MGLVSKHEFLIFDHQFFHSFHDTCAWFGVPQWTRIEVVSKMSGFGIVYTLDMDLDQLLPFKIHSNFSSSNKMTKFWQSPSFLSLHMWNYFLRLPVLHIMSTVAYSGSKLWVVRPYCIRVLSHMLRTAIIICVSPVHRIQTICAMMYKWCRFPQLWWHKRDGLNWIGGRMVHYHWLHQRSMFRFLVWSKNLIFVISREFANPSCRHTHSKVCWKTQ